MNRYELLRDGATVYELDEDGVNRWCFNVQPGIGLDGYRQPDSVIERVARDAKVSMSYHHRLREALDNLHRDSLGSFEYRGSPRCAEVDALLAKLDNLEQTK